MFVNIDNTFFIKKKITQKKLHECTTFISNQKNIKKLAIEKAYKNNISKIITLPTSINNKDVDIIIKTKFNKDYKFINLDKFEIFYEVNEKIQLAINKFDKLQLNKIKFFPPIYVFNDLVFQKLAKGSYYRPNNLAEFNPNLLNSISEVFKILSSMKNNEAKVADFLANFKTSCIKDSLNSKIINIFIIMLKNNKNETFRTSLTHGDFKFEHLFNFDDKLEYVVDWENVGVRSIFFDLLNFFTPWFVHRSFDYSQIKNYIHKFIQFHHPYFLNLMSKKYDLYFSIFALERYLRINNARSIEFNLDEAYKRYNFIFKKLTDGLNIEY